MSEQGNPLDLSDDDLRALGIFEKVQQARELKKAKGRRYIRVNTKYYKLVNGDLVVYNKETIRDETPKDFYRTIPAYDGFVNEPQYFDFEQEISKGDGIFWNLHNALPYTPEPGSIKTIERLLRHVFGERYEMALDWFQILLTMPKQPLPIPCFVSEEQETGKTSVLKLIQYLIPGNTAAISIDTFSDPFNAHFVSKHVVLIDETETEGTYNAKAVSSKLKRWVTQETVIRNEKHGAIVEIPFHGKLVMCSNHEDSFIRIEDEDTRYWIIKPPGKPGKKDPNFFDNLRAECKHFVHFLQHRTLETSVKQGRLWFSTEQIRTEEFATAVESGRSNIYHVLKELLLEDLITYNRDEWWYTSTELMQVLGNPKNFGYVHLKKMIEKNFKKTAFKKRMGSDNKKVFHFTKVELEELLFEEQKVELQKTILTDANGKVLF